MNNKRDNSNRQTAAIIIAALTACPTLVLGMLLPCLFVLIPIIALMVYGIIIASMDLCA